MTTRVALAGATGRMGGLISRLIAESSDFELAVGLSSADPLEVISEAAVDVVVDVTTPEASGRVVDYAVAHGHNVLVGSSGWSADRIAALESRLAGRLDVGVLIVPNFSLGSVLSTLFAGLAGRFFDSVEIIESHHAGKVDSPSGTAVRTAERIAAARGGVLAPPNATQPARGQTVEGIPVHSLRLRGVVADQQVVLGGTGESLNIRHETYSQDAYVDGIRLALRAVTGLEGLEVGLDGLLGLDEFDAPRPSAGSGA